MINIFLYHLHKNDIEYQEDWMLQKGVECCTESKGLKTLPRGTLYSNKLGYDLTF